MASFKDKLNMEQQKKLDRIMTDTAIKCKCGHPVHIPAYLDYIVCSWCGKNVFKTPKDEFIYRAKEVMYREKRKNANLEKN